jgi:tetraacyldisaccharide 4'-kinase
MKRPLLLPLVPLYAAGLALRELRIERGWEQVRRLRYPVISIGNLSTGGSGKTPLTIALVRLLAARGFHVDVLSRGYGRSSAVPLRVDVSGSAEEFGDEPLLIAHTAGVPVYVAAERHQAGMLAEREATTGADSSRLRVHILDDGFQHRQLMRDIDVLLLNREDWHDCLLPAGNLREGLDAMKRATVIAIPADDAGLKTDLHARGWTGPIWRIRRRMDVPRIAGPVAAFCGIARPGQFFSGLRAAGITLASHQAFPDHHRYTAHNLETVLSTARSMNAASVITTEKDLVRIGSLASVFPPDLPLKTAGLTEEIEDESAVATWIEETIEGLRRASNQPA